MKITGLFVAACLVIFASTALGSSITGKWIGKMQGPNGDSEMTFTFNVAADTLSGSVGSPMGDMPISNGKVSGKTFSFDVSMGDMVITHQCTIDGDTITMKVKGFGDEPMEMILKRAVEKK
jgi:hypothetical protein